MKQIFTNLLFLLLSLSAFSQTTIIIGNITQEQGEPLPGVNIYLQGTYDGSSSNADGNYLLKTSRTGQQTLRVEFMGYEPIARPVTLSGDTLRLNFKPKETFNELSSVTITAGTFEASDKKQAVTITPLDMMTTAGAAGDVYGALQALPGTTTNGESGRLFVKGGDSDESQTYIDGSLVMVPYNSSAPNIAARGRFNPFMFKGNIFSTGGYSAEYGQALSSVLQLNTNDMPAEDQLDLSFLTVGPEVSGTKRWNSGAVTASLTYHNLEPYMNVIKQNYDWQHAPESGNGELSFRQKTSKTGMLKFYTNIGTSNFMLKQQSLENGGQFFNYKLNNNNQFVNASWNDKLGENWSMNIAASYTNNVDNIHYEETSVDKTIRGFYIKDALLHTINDRVSLKFGAEIFDKTYTQKVAIADEFHDNSYTDHTFSAFSEAQLYTSSKFVTRIGGRVEYSEYLNRWSVAPRISTAWKVSKQSQFSAAYGWFYQNPTDDYLLYTDQLKPQRADHYTFSFQSATDKRTFRAELYYKDYKNLAKLNDTQFYLPSSYSNSGNGYAKGLDVFWRDSKSIKNGNYWISYSYIDTKRNYLDYPHTAVPSFTSKHNFSMVYKHWIPGMRSLAGLNIKYSSPRVYNDPNSNVFNGEKMLPYRSIDLSWSFLYRSNIIFYGAVTNVTGFKQEFGRRFSQTADSSGKFAGTDVGPAASRFIVLGCFITLTKSRNANQLDKIE